MYKNIKKKLFRRSVQKLFIGRDALFALNKPESWSSPYTETYPYSYIASWDRYLTDINWPVRLVNQCFADGFNKHETAATLISRFIAVNPDDDNSEEYAHMYGLFEESPKIIQKKLQRLNGQGEIKTSIVDVYDKAFSDLYEKYPEFRQEQPPEPVEIWWWELSSNDQKTDTHRVKARFETVQEVVDFITEKEGTDELFWEYPSSKTSQEWQPTVPPVNGSEQRSILAIPRRGWDTLWNKCEGVVYGSNFDHWEALKKSAYVRPLAEQEALHGFLDKTYQKEMFG